MKWGYQRQPNRRSRNGEFVGTKGRTREIQLIVIHTGEISPKVSNGSSPAERLSAYMSNPDGRSVSWHATTDDTTVLHEIPAQWTTAHVRGWNSRGIGIEIATKHDLWDQLDADRVDAYIENLARLCAWYCQRFDLPAVQVQSKGAAESGAKGLIAHSTLDPARRKDPGPAFPWSDLLRRVEGILASGGVLVGLGDRGPHVEAAQQLLHDKGYGAMVGAIDGAAGPKFDDAVRALEKDSGQPTTGLLPHQGQLPEDPGGGGGEKRQQITLSGSVGRHGLNDPRDVEMVTARLGELGFGMDSRPLVHSIRLFQAAKAGAQTLGGTDGRVDPGGDTLAWMNAANAPRWVHMPAGSDAEGFRSKERTQTNDNHGWGTSWLADSLRRAAAHYRDNYRSANPGAALIWSNDASPRAGGNSPDHGGHEAGMQLDLVLPPGNDGRGMVVSDPAYDRNATRAMLTAFWETADIAAIYLNDSVLIKAGLCKRSPGHHNHIHVAINAPKRATAGGGGAPIDGITIDWDFIEGLEGFRSNGYVPTDGAGNPLDRSGVTIGGGFDLGQHRVEYAHRLGIRPDIISELTPYFGLRGWDALAFLRDNPLQLSTEDARHVDRLVKGNKAVAVASHYDAASQTPFRQIPAAAQTVIVSVLFQYGGPKAAPRFWSYATSQNWRSVIDELRDFGDKYTTRRHKEARYLEGRLYDAVVLEVAPTTGSESLWHTHSPATEVLGPDSEPIVVETPLAPPVPLDVDLIDDDCAVGVDDEM